MNFHLQNLLNDIYDQLLKVFNTLALIHSRMPRLFSLLNNGRVEKQKRPKVS